MSGGIVYSEEEINPILEKFQEAMGRFDALISRINSLESIQVKLKESLDNLTSVQSICNAEFRLEISNLNNIANDHVGKIDCNTSLVNENKKNIQNHDLEINKMRLDVDASKIQGNSHGEKLSRIEESYVTKLCLDSVINDFEVFKNKSSAYFEQFNDLGYKYKNFEKECSPIIQKIKIFLDEYENKSVRFDLNIIEVKRDIDDIKKIIIESYEKNKKYVDDSISGMSNSIKNIEDTSKYAIKSDVDASISRTLSSFESISLDAKNAFLKSSNSATQVDLINKKLENIQLLIKKFELSKE